MTQLNALLLTLFVEAPVVIIAFRSRVTRFGGIFAWAITPTLITHPLLFTASAHLPKSMPYFTGVFVLETAVVVIEGLLLSFMTGASFFACLLISLIANAASVAAGLIWWLF